MDDMIINPDDDKSDQQITWLSLIKSWTTLLFTCISAVTLLVVLVLGVKVMVWRMQGGGSLLPQNSARPSPRPSPTVTLALPSPSPAIPEVPEVTWPSPLPIATAGVTPNASSSVSPSVPATPVPSLPFKLVIPVAGLRPERLRDTYTDARSEGRLHNAIDIMAARGTPVVAAADGRILKLFSSGRGGITIYQLGPDQKTVFYYAHLDHYADGLGENKQVRQGETIGYVGDTGNAGSGNYHLHFAIWLISDPKHYWNGETINPYPLLRQGN